MMNKPVNEREIVLGILMEITENGTFSHVILREVLGKYQYLPRRERAFITRVTEGTLEHLIEIDYILDHVSKVKVKKMKAVIRNILRMSVYQLKFMDSVPDRAVCSEAVKLAGRKGFINLKGFVNGVLRNVARQMDEIPYPEDPTAALSVRYSCPEWIIRYWQKTWSGDVIEKILEDFQREKPLTVRCCLDRTTPERLKEQFAREGVRAETHPYLPYALCISGFDHLEALESFREGMFAVQDISSMLAGEIADPRKDDFVIDVCAAPGGKALHVAEKLALAGGGRVQARDISERKVELIRENIRRLSGAAGAENPAMPGNVAVDAVCMDAAVLDEASVGKADLVIADLPCSGLGVLGKKPDLKYRVTQESVEELAQLQRKILTCAREYVKPGGVLLYSTCTISRAENMDNVHWFLEQFPEFAPDPIGERLCPELRDSVQEEGCIQLLPGVHKCDGFFIARLKKKAEAGKEEGTCSGKTEK